MAADPYYDLDGREGDLAAVFTTPGGELLPSLELAQHGLAVVDLRYLTTLERVCQVACGPFAELGKAFILNMLDCIVIGSDGATPNDIAMNYLRIEVQ